MLAKEQYELRNVLEDRGIIFCYSGYMTEGILSGIGDALKQKLALEGTDSNIVRGVFSIFVEQMQNIIRYSAEREPETKDEFNVLSYGVLSIGRNNDEYFITCANKIKQEDVERLDSYLKFIQNMNKQELKILYKKQLRSESPEGSKGAGVGFIDIAKRASKPIEFDFMKLDDSYSFFSLKAQI